jgi:Raf kinase inhibitor-like YbhB/YbcL family protein
MHARYLMLFCALCGMPALADAPFRLSSPDFTDNARLAPRFAGNASDNPNCSGENHSPALNWYDAPAGTRSFALLMHDPEGAKGLGVTHLVAYNIPASSSGFTANDLRDGKGYTGGTNTPGNTRWHGPCPPPGTSPHHYTFTLIATALEPNLPAGLTREALMTRLKGHALGAAGLVGRFSQ